MLSDFPRIGDLFLGRYRVESILGSGGFARVYLATQIDLDREIAIKVIRPAVDTEEGDSEETLAQIQLVEQRFRREARVISKFRSPYTVVVHDYGRTKGGLLYMTLEYVDGRPLSDLIVASAPVEPARVVHIVIQVLESLHEAHSFDVLHRDIKPGNIMVYDHLEQTDLIKVLDFGIAKILEVEEESHATEDLTSDGTLIGTPRYMSPEQIRGDKLSPASDLYSLGLVAFELLTGAKAVSETTTMRIIARHLDPRPLEFPDSVELPPRLAAIISRMIAKEPRERYGSALELLESLRAWDAEADAPVAPSAMRPDQLPTVVSTSNPLADMSVDEIYAEVDAPAENEQDVLSTVPMKAAPFGEFEPSPEEPPRDSRDFHAQKTMLLDTSERLAPVSDTPVDDRIRPRWLAIGVAALVLTAVAGVSLFALVSEPDPVEAERQVTGTDTPSVPAAVDEQGEREEPLAAVERGSPTVQNDPTTEASDEPETTGDDDATAEDDVDDDLEDEVAPVQAADEAEDDGVDDERTEPETDAAPKPSHQRPKPPKERAEESRPRRFFTVE